MLLYLVLNARYNYSSVICFGKKFGLLLNVLLKCSCLILEFDCYGKCIYFCKNYKN